MDEAVAPPATAHSNACDALSVLDCAADGIFVVDASWRLTFVNAAARALLGDHPEVMGGRLLDVFPHAAGTAAAGSLQHVMSARVPAEAELYVASRQRWYTIQAAPLPDGGVAVYFRDSTARRSVDAALVRSQAQLQAVFDTAPVGIVIAEAPSGRIIMGNAQAELILGHPLIRSAGTAGYAAYAGLHADGRPVLAEEYPLARAVRGETTLPGLEVHYRRGDGRLAWIRIAGAPSQDASGAVVLATCTLTDIDDEKRDKAALASLNAGLERTVTERTGELSATVDALQIAQARVRPLFEQSPIDMLLVQVDDAVTILESNRAFGTTVGLDPAALAGQTFTALFGKVTGGILAADCHAALERGGFDRHHTLLLPSGERTVHTFYQPVHNGAQRRVLLTQLDLTEARRVEMQLRQAQRHDAVGQLSGGVAHDFNNLLTAIIGSLELLGRQLPDERQQRYLNTAVAAAQRGANLTQQLLAYARKQYLAPKPTVINDVVAGMAEMLQRSLGGLIAVQVEPAPEPWPAMVDETQLELVLLNLAINARDSMPLGGHLTIATDTLARGDKRLPAELEAGDYVRLTATDTGCGMSPEVVARAMEPFFTTKPIGKGSGLGLAQAYGFARQLGGTVRLSSREGEGTRVEVFLPRAMSAAAPPVQAQPGHPGGPDTGAVLLVDDDTAVRDVAASLLREEGWTVTEAHNGPTAIALLSAGDSFDAVLVDVGMPGMSGIELATQLRTRSPQLPIIFVTGNADPLIADQLDGMVVTKPYRVADLIRALREARVRALK